MFNGLISDGSTEVPLLASHTAIAELVEHNRYVPPDLNKANSFCNSAGRDPGQGWVVVRRSSLLSLNLDGLQTLTFRFGGVEVPFYGLVITREPINLFPANTADHPDSAYLVHLADSRWRVCNPHFCVSIAKMYNVPSNASNGSGGPTTYLAASRNGGVDWTWATMVEDIWNLMSGQIGAFPGLPFSPHGSPTGWIFQGVSAWDALCDVLERIGCTISADVTLTASQFGIVRIGGDDAANDAKIAEAIVKHRKISDGEYIDVERGRFPAGVRVFFHKQLSTPTAIPPFLMNEVYTVDVAGSVSGAEAGVYHPIWDDLPALVDGSATVTNTTELAARAQERADDFYRTLRDGGARFWQRFTGLLILGAGAKIKSVVYTSNGGGVTTDVMGHPFASTIGEESSRDYATAGTVQDLIRLGFPSTAPSLSGGTPTTGFTNNTIVYIDNSSNITSSTNLVYNDTTNLFSVIANTYFDIDNYTFTVINSDTTIKYIFVDDSLTTVYIWEQTLIVNNGSVFIDISTGGQTFYIWNQTDYYFKVDDSTNIVTIWNSTVTIDNGYVFIDISTGDQIFQVWNQTDIYIKVDDSTSIISFWNSTVLIDNGSVKIDISTGDQIFYLWNQTDYYFKVDDSTNILNLWNSTVTINDGSIIFDILTGGFLFQIWDQTNYFLKIDKSTGDITFWNSFVQMNSTYWKFAYSSVTFFWVDASDYSILIGKPGKATSDTTGYVYWYSINGRPTGTPATKTGYYSSIWDYASNRFWWWTGSAWILPCCWVIVKITFADTPKTAKYNELIWVDTSGGGVTVNLPAPIQNGEVQIQKTTTDANAITLASPISGSIVGPTTWTNSGQTYTARSDGTDWYVDDVCLCVPAGTDAGDLLVWNGTDAWEVLPIDADDYVLTADSAESLGVKWAAAGAGDANLHWVKFTKTYADFSAAATTNTLTLLTLDPQTYIRDVVIKHSVAFSGGSISNYVIDVGLTPSASFFISAFNVFSAVNDGNSSTSGSTTFQYASTGLTAKATSSSANLNAATAGSVDIWVLISVLP